MLENINFIDPQGTTHTGAVFKVRSADENMTSNNYLRLSSADFNTFDQSNNPQVCYVNFEVYYWTSAAAKAAGAVPYILVNTTNTSMAFNFVADATYSALALEAKVEKYLTDVVLPPMLIA